MASWYIVQTYSGQEEKAETFIRAKLADAEFKKYILDVRVPKEDVHEMRNGKKRTYKRKKFPGYLLVEMDFTPAGFQLVKSIPGIINFVNYDGSKDPRPLSRTELRNLIDEQKEEGKVEQVVHTKSFRIDDRVKIVDGAFKDFSGIVEEINDEKGRLKVRVEIFGRSTPVDVDFLQIERI